MSTKVGEEKESRNECGHHHSIFSCCRAIFGVRKGANERCATGVRNNNGCALRKENMSGN